jgi:hypothetical protein
MKLVKKIALWFFGIVAALVLAVVGLHVYYRLTPVELSEEAQTLLAETAHMAQLTENGYRLHGLLAPEGMDPVQYGKCLEKAHVEHARQGSQLFKKFESDAQRDAVFKAHGEQLAKNTERCAQGKPTIRGLAPPQGVKLAPGQPLSAWTLASTSPDLTSISARWRAVLSGGARGSVPDPTSAMFASYQTPLETERIHLARFASGWITSTTNAQKREAWHSISTRIAPLVAFADGTLLESMIAGAGVSRQLLLMQTAASGGTDLDDVLAREMIASITEVDRLPAAIANAIGAEFQVTISISEGMLGGRFDNSGYAPVLVDWLGRFAFDRNDTLNIFAMGYRDGQDAVRSKSKGSDRDSRAYVFAINLGCPALGDWSWSCLVFERNATGRVMSAIAIPAYNDYGNRAWDVVNLAAATRLTIEARRRGLEGDALAQFVAAAPEGMRDVYSGKPFAYDTVKKKLTIELRARSTVLGEKSYELSL